MNSPQAWLDAFGCAAAEGNGRLAASLFREDGLWRDYLPFGFTLQTIEGHTEIAEFVEVNALTTGFRNAGFEGRPDDREGFFRFRTCRGNGRGYLRLQDGLCTTLFTMLEDLAYIPEHRSGTVTGPYVLIVGGGQGGLALGAQLSVMGVPYLIVDRHPRVGDQWRSRYDSLILHDPVWYDHLPFIPFPEDWPVFTPKDRMGDWLEAYAGKLSLSIQVDTEFVGAEYQEAEGVWEVSLRKGGASFELRPTHLVFALGISGFPKVPAFNGRERFQGPQLHSSAYRSCGELQGRRVVVVGANNSAYDIAVDLARNGARPTMIQRSSTLVVRQSDYCDRVLGPLYSAEAVKRGITTEKADILNASLPLRLFERQHRAIWDQIRHNRRDYYDRLGKAGFRVDFAEDGTGLATKYRRTASGYYIDVGGAEMVVNGLIEVRSGVNVTMISDTAVHLDSGEKLPADAIVYATGYGTMTDWVAALIGTETAGRIGPCWGYGSGTKGDPGPWLGELRNMWLPTRQPGLWFTGGNLAQSRYYSRLLGLQLLERFVRGRA